MALSLVFAVGGYAFAAGFSDTSGHWAEGQINKWAQNGLAGGYSDGTFKPNNQITRAEFVAMVNRAFGIDTKGFTADFSDVAAGQWYYGDIAAASASGYTGGYPDGTFKPKQSISRQEAASIMVRLLKLEPTTQGLDKFKDATRIPQWSRSSIGAIAKAGFMAGYPDGTFQPGKSITRAEAVASLDRARETAPPVEVEDAFLEGTVTRDDKAVAGATVRVFKADGYAVLKEAKTDSKGCYKFALAAGKYDITAVTDNSVAYQSDIVLAQDKSAAADLELVPAAVISGTLNDKSGSKVKKATMLFTTNPTFVITTGSDGSFTGAVLPDKKYAVRVYKPGKEDDEPVLVPEDVAVGAAGARDVGILKAPFSLTSAPGGGGPNGDGISSPTIKSIDDIKATVALNGSYSLPDKVTAKMSNDTTEEFAVTWVPNTVSTDKAGVFTFEGTISGYNQKAKLILRVEAPLGDDVTVDNEVPLAFEDGVTVDFTNIPSISGGVTVTVTECDEDDYETPTTGQTFEVAGKVINVSLSSNLDLSDGVEITLPFEGTASDGLAIFYYNETTGDWECADSTVDEVNKVVRATVYHFSKWGVVKAARVEAPAASPQAGTVAKGTEVVLSTSTNGAVIYYTTDGKNPIAKKHGTLYEGPITVNANTTIKAIAVKNNMKNSHVKTFEYTVTEQNPRIDSITNGTIDQQNKKIILDKNPSNLSDSEIELYSPSGESILEIKLNGSLLGSWNFENGSNDIALGSSIAGVNISQTAAALLEVGLSHQDVLDAVNFSRMFEAIKNSSSKQAFYENVLQEIMDIANDDENLTNDARKEIYAALNIPAINNAADTATKQKIKDILQPAVNVYNSRVDDPSDTITVSDLVGSDCVDVFAAIDASTCKEDFYNAVNITGLYDAITSSANYSALIDAVNEKDVIEAISENAEKTTIMAMALVVYDYLDSLAPPAKAEILNAVNINQLMVALSDKTGDDLKVIVKDEANTSNQTVYTVNVEQ